MIEKIYYDEIVDKEMTPSRNVVVSKCSKGGFTIAQRLNGPENEENMKMFLKGAFHINNTEEIKNLIAALEEALKKVE